MFRGAASLFYVQDFCTSYGGMLVFLAGLAVQLPAGYDLTDGVLEVNFDVPQNITAADVAAVLAAGSFTQLRLGSGVIVIEEAAFYNSALKQVIANDDSSVRAILTRGFGYSADLATVRLPGSLQWIGNYVFSGCVSLRTLDLSSTSLEALGSMVVFACTVLTSVRLPETIRVLGEYCFDSAYGLTSIDLPSSVEILGWSVFYECRSLAEVTTDHTQLREVSNWAFARCSALRTVTFPESLETVGSSAFRDCTALVEVTLPDGANVIGQATFQNCAALTRIHLPTSLVQILGSAFQLCRRLRTVTWPQDLAVVGEMAFAGCSALSRVDLLGATVVGVEAFTECTGLRTLTLGEVVQRILTRAFRNCVNLTEVVLPQSVREVGSEAFANCGEVWHLALWGDITSLASNAFFAVTDVAVLEIRSTPPDELMMTYCMALIPVVETAASLWGPMDEFCGVRTVQLGKGKSKAGAIAGGVIGGLAAAALIAVALYFITKAASNKAALAPAAESYDAIETPLS